MIGLGLVIGVKSLDCWYSFLTDRLKSFDCWYKVLIGRLFFYFVARWRYFWGRALGMISRKSPVSLCHNFFPWVLWSWHGFALPFLFLKVFFTVSLVSDVISVGVFPSRTTGLLIGSYINLSSLPLSGADLGTLLPCCLGPC